MTSTKQTETRCGGCRRVLTAPASVAAGYGPTCIRRVRADVADFTIDQTVKAVRLVADGSITRIRGGVDALFQIQSGHRRYWASYTDCTCEGAADRGSCYHLEAVRIWARNNQPAPTSRRYATAA